MENSQNKFKRLSGTCELSTDSTTDYILPDYLGDIRRILFTECAIGRSGHYSDGGTDEFSGTVVYEVVYLDADEKPARATFTSDFDMRLKADEGRCAAICAPTVSSFYIRSTGPRRFSAGATVTASVRCISFDEISCTGDAFENSEMVQRLESVLNLRCAAESEHVERELSGSIERLDGATLDEVGILFSGARVTVNRAVAEGDGVRLEGEVRLYSLLSVDGAPIYLAEKTVPFEEILQIDGAGDMTFIPNAEISTVTATVNPDEAGCEIMMSAAVELSAIGEYNERMTSATDAFVAGASTENSYREYRYSELYDACYAVILGVGELSSEKVCSEKLRDIPYLSGTVKLSSVSLLGDEAELCGELRVTGVASVTNEEGEISYSALKFSLPICERIKCNSRGDADARLDISVSPVWISASVDTESVAVSYKLCCKAVCSGTSTKTILMSAMLTPGEESERGKTITVYYPTEGDTLFGVAKKFSVPLAEIAVKNELSASVCADGSEPLAGVERLFIY